MTEILLEGHHKTRVIFLVSGSSMKKHHIVEMFSGTLVRGKKKSLGLFWDFP